MKYEDIPTKIHEIIAYLAHTFKSKVMEEEDIRQDLYAYYLELIKKKKYKNAKPGYFFIKFKWLLLTQYRKEINRINKQWEYILNNYEKRTKLQSRIGYLDSNRQSKS